MEQREINQAEWNNPDNWSGPSWIRLYFSKRDSRTWVPKPNPALGKTINLGSNAGAYWFLGAVLLAPAIIFVSLILIRIFN